MRGLYQRILRNVRRRAPRRPAADQSVDKGQRELTRGIRGPQSDDAAHYLRPCMAQLRRKIEANPSRPRYLLTEPGMGYRFQPDEATDDSRP